MSDALSGDRRGLPGVASSEARQRLDEKIQHLDVQEKEKQTQAQASTLGLNYIDLQGFPINPDSISVIPQATAVRLGLVCFWYSIDDLRLGITNSNSEELRAYAASLGREHYATPVLYLISEASFKSALKVYERAPKFRKVVRGVTITEHNLEQASEKISSLKDLAANIERAAATEAVTMVIAGGLKTRASDIHLEAEEGGVKLRYRIDGVLYMVATVPAATAAKAIPRLKLLSGLKINVADRPQDGRFTIHLKNDEVDVRVSSLPTVFGESIVMRLLRGSGVGVAFESLGLVGTAYKLLSVEMRKPNGMILSTGPTGSGKNTTLYAIINTLNNAELKIITIEDPIEYKLPGVNQSQVEADRGYTFATGLRSILRQDPNVIMIGEIRDPETADTAVQSALTGHLVLSTLHTNNAAGAIPRLLSLGAKATLLPSALNASIGQRLVRRLCASCKVPDTPPEMMLAEAEAVLKKVPAAEQQRISAKHQFLKGAGCDECQGLGYKGQIGIFEVLVMTPDLKKAVVADRASDTVVEELAEAAGMVTMFQDGVLKALAGLTALSEVFRVTRE